EGVLTAPVTTGIVFGLLLGKTLGISAGAWLAVRMKLAGLPEDIRWAQIIGAAAICGIGFTVSLFMAGLVFDSHLLTMAKIGILIGSLLSAVAGFAILMIFRRRAEAPQP
ncbi:MAG TPA: Na+/H+ antiporter NhaA, partial [Actinomycetota bacterium]|nr:Na+/H+ antiporter NhaA [Actinomycetota bacterium]